MATKTVEITITDEGRDALYTARWAALSNEPIPESALPQLMGVLTPLLGPPPASMWPRGNEEPEKPEIPSSIYTDTKWLVTGNNFPIVGVGFTREQFKAYVNAIPNGDMTWAPDFVTLHATSSPTLSMRPNGWSKENMLSLRNYYMKSPNGWSSGPHLFVDDKLIWLFTPLIRRGTHSPSFNSKGIGAEALGDYPTPDSPTSGRGALVWDNVYFAAAVLNKKFNLGEARYHNDDPRTDHTSCPLPKSYKAASLAAIKNHMNNL